MHYPEGFKSDVVEVLAYFFPEKKGVFQDILDSGSELVGEYLQQAASSPFKASEVVRSIQEGEIDNLLLKARMTVKASSLFREWKKLYLKQTGKHSRLVG